MVRNGIPINVTLRFSSSNEIVENESLLSAEGSIYPQNRSRCMS